MRDRKEELKKALTHFKKQLARELGYSEDLQYPDEIAFWKKMIFECKEKIAAC